MRNDQGEWITSGEGKANKLNNFFTSVFQKNENDVLPEFTPKVTSMACDLFVTVDKVEALLKGPDISKYVGPDEVHPRLLKETADSTAEPMIFVFNKSISEGDIPGEWRHVYIFKNGDKT